MEEYVHDLLSFNFNGRMNRLKYWTYILYGFILVFALSMLVKILHIDSTTVQSGISLVYSILCLPFAVRRLHDLDKSPLWLVLCFIPVVNFFFSIYIGFFKGTDGPNKYGPDPLAK